MNFPDETKWLEQNQMQLSLALNSLRALLERHSAGGDDVPLTHAAQPQQDAPGPATFLEYVINLFGLSAFEGQILLLCAGVELDGRFSALCATLHGDGRRAQPTFSLALACLPGAHWSALTPEAPLRFWRLIEVLPGDTLTTSPLRIDERILHFLVGTATMDVRLRNILRPLPSAVDLPPSHQHIADQIADLWMQRAPTIRGIGLWGPEPSSKSAIVAAACAQVGWRGQVMRLQDFPVSQSERVELLRLWRREALLSEGVLVLEDQASMQGLPTEILENLDIPFAVIAREPLRDTAGVLIGFEVPRPTASEQSALWKFALNDSIENCDEVVNTLVGQFDLDPVAINAAVVDAGVHRANGDISTSRALWQAARRQARPRLEALAQMIQPMTDWDGLVLPHEQKHLLQEIVASVRQRYKVYETWGLAANGRRGLGVATLFAGASGTGKTLAAEVIANALNLDLYRIDLSSVVSKYIGETEKNLRSIFDAAERGGAVLLFDEADALFGKRSEVRDSHDRYANIEVSYLLQRMESYRGLAILTTNMKNSLDSAFVRRLRFIVQFPFPDASLRTEIWRRVYPHDTPTDALDPIKLARLQVTGGNIRNIALNAAFLAADAGEPIRMSHMLRAARSEYAKLDQPLGETETRGWQ
ncbi:MAG: ATP-binding protein [Gammaproteobacteria bacterium]|nr:ATP-binding protein [Gammaproteobacteria bacterium]